MDPARWSVHQRRNSGLSTFSFIKMIKVVTSSSSASFERYCRSARTISTNSAIPPFRRSAIPVLLSDSLCGNPLRKFGSDAGRIAGVGIQYGSFKAVQNETREWKEEEGKESFQRNSLQFFKRMKEKETRARRLVQDQNLHQTRFWVAKPRGKILCEGIRDSIIVVLCTTACGGFDVSIKSDFLAERYIW